jgi:1-pyrroline-5-carboxylate dehydrogenase
MNTMAVSTEPATDATRGEDRGPSPSGGPTSSALPPLARPRNEPPLGYAPGSEDRRRLDRELRELRAGPRDLPLVIAGQEIGTELAVPAVIPHDHAHVLAHVHQATEPIVEAAIEAACDAWQDWHRWSWADRAAVFLRAAALASGPYRDGLVAATMLDQSKTVSEAEADAACELADFLRFNAYNMRRMLEEQPHSSNSSWNRMEYRALEGFIYAVTPFNFTAIAGNLPTAPALLGNTVVWKPSPHATLAPSIIIALLREAGLPDGVINLVYGDAEVVSRMALADSRLAGVHFTGSERVFRELWRQVGANMSRYRSFPRLVGETGGKDFLVAHNSADEGAVAEAIIKGAFGYQGQKCSAVSRVYVCESMWSSLAEQLCASIDDLRLGDVCDPETDLGAVISKGALARHRAALEVSVSQPDTRVLAGGRTHDERGWFVEPTLIETRRPACPLLREELFGPIVCAFVYPDHAWIDVLRLIDRTGDYALTGSIFANERAAVRVAEQALEYSAGNLYINDKPTGAIVGEQPFGGGRRSGTNDKAGTVWHLSRWASIRTVKETFPGR